MSSGGQTPELESAVDHLVTILHQPIFTGEIHDILSNLVYYIPRLRRKRKLEQLVSGFLESQLWSMLLGEDRSVLQETAEAIFSWKLSISEPVISVAEFYAVWDRAIKNCKAWNISKLTVLTGILGTRAKLDTLQTQFFLDDSNSVSGKYRNWKYELFMPVWRQLFRETMKHSPREAEYLAVLLSCIYENRDVNEVMGEQLAPVLLQLSLTVINDYKKSPSFVSKNLGSIAKTLESTLSKTNIVVVTNALRAVTATTFDISLREMHAPRANYSTQIYSNQLLTVISILRGCLSRPAIPKEWYSQVIMSLFYVDFIAQDFGKKGFQSYEYIYKISVAGCTVDVAQYYNCLDTMRGNIYQSSGNNVVNNSRILYLLNFLEFSLGIVPVTPDFLSEFFVPVVTFYAASSDANICEAAQATQLCLYNNKSAGEFLQVWKTTHYLEFLEQSTQRFLAGVLKSSQLIHIFAAIAQEIPALKPTNPDISREVLHYTYLLVLNHQKESSEVVSTLIQCLAQQLPHIKTKYITGWLENIIELIQFCPAQKEKIFDCLWKQINSGLLPDDRALSWFLSSQSKL
ncbi:Pex8p LALA0_S01e01640g [Lachancea lanzarotensis]|uniref:LALA0S01e01640g1_1 n=1 Tax=Lachancea lanzarotensis TaxID=1245769 RepID=A0A0C7MX75_9SACH|nr:uncharacterized protein LALA0_S01e01640g [Lachancea lanzarotensis]CEP60040.1 LALA0S01e01640g1_1 [Lachancea lanzarotensis]